VGGGLPAALEEGRGLCPQGKELRLRAGDHAEGHRKRRAGKEQMQVDTELVHELVQQRAFERPSHCGEAAPLSIRRLGGARHAVPGGVLGAVAGDA
jgi:hypothetical protein